MIVGQLKITRSGQVNTHLIYPDDMREWVPSTYQQIGFCDLQVANSVDS